MSISSEDIKVCDCCGRPTVEGGIRKIQEVEDATDKEFWLCESCEMKLKECGITSEQVNVFLADMSVIFDIWAMAESGKSAEYFLSLARIWSNWGLNCEDS